jgi:hypothetical protein
MGTAKLSGMMIDIMNNIQISTAVNCAFHTPHSELAAPRSQRTPPVKNRCRPAQEQTLPELSDRAMEAASIDNLWSLLLRDTIRFAEYQVQRLCWRGEFDGLLPGGFDANSIAAQAIHDFLLASEPAIRSENRPQAVPAASAMQSEIQFEVNRLILRIVTRLHHRKENFSLCNADDLPLVEDLDGDFVSALELIPAPDIQPDEAILQEESNDRFHQLKQRFTTFLANDRPAIRLLELGCDGIYKPQALAPPLKLRVRTIYNLRERLQRAWRRFTHAPKTRNPGKISR